MWRFSLRPLINADDTFVFYLQENKKTRFFSAAHTLYADHGWMWRVWIRLPKNLLSTGTCAASCRLIHTLWTIPRSFFPLGISRLNSRQTSGNNNKIMPYIKRVIELLGEIKRSSVKQHKSSAFHPLIIIDFNHLYFLCLPFNSS